MFKILTALFACLFSFSVWAKTVTLHTNFGNIKIDLNEQQAPISSQNFLQYAQNGFYQETIFHRVIDGFMIQGGGFKSGMEQKETAAAIKNEANNGLKNLRGTIAMARTSDPHSATSQFFINLQDNAFLDFTEESGKGWGYAVFGKVVEGMDVVDKIAKVPTSRAGFHRDVPQQEVIIQSVTVE